MKLAALALTVVALTGCSAAADPKPAAAPSPTVSTTVKADRAACDVISEEVPKQTAIAQGAGSQGTQTYDDAAEAFRSLQTTAGEQSGRASDPLSGHLSSLSDAYGRARVALVNFDDASLSAATTELQTALNNVEDACQALPR